MLSHLSKYFYGVFLFTIHYVDTGDVAEGSIVYHVDTLIFGENIQYLQKKTIQNFRFPSVTK